MTHRGNSQDVVEDNDLSKRKASKIANCSSVHSNSNLPISLSSPARRQSSRLKKINTIRGSADASSLRFQQPKFLDYNSLVSDEIMVEAPVKGSNRNKNTRSRYSENNIVIDGGSDSDDSSITFITLKEFQAKCKAKKQKFLKPDAPVMNFKNCCSPNLYQKHNHANVKQEKWDTDLDERLISLKQKLAERPNSERKRRKCGNLSERFTCTGGMSACLVSSSGSCVKSEPFEDDKQDSTVLSRENSIKADKFIPSSLSKLESVPLNTDRPETLADIKVEITLNGSYDVQNVVDATNGSPTGLITKCSLDNIHAKWSGDDNGGEVSEEVVSTNSSPSDFISKCSLPDVYFEQFQDADVLGFKEEVFSTNDPSLDYNTNWSLHDVHSEWSQEGNGGDARKEGFSTSSCPLTSITTCSLRDVHDEGFQDASSCEFNNVFSSNGPALDCVTKCNLRDVHEEYFQESNGGELSKEVFSIQSSLHLCCNDSTKITGQSSTESTGLKTNLSAHNSEVLWDAKIDTLEPDNPVFDATIYVASSSNVDFIAKYNCSANLLQELKGGKEGHPEAGKVAYSVRRISGCCVNENCIENVEHDKFKCFPGCVEEVACIERLETVSATMVSPEYGDNLDKHDSTLGDSIHYSTVNQLNGQVASYGEILDLTKSTNICASTKVNEENDILAGEKQAEKLTICSFNTEVAIAETFSLVKSSDSAEPSESTNQIDGLSSVIDDTLLVDLQTNHEDEHFISEKEGCSAKRTVDIRRQQSKTCFEAAASSKTIVDSSRRTNCISPSVKMSNDYLCKIRCDSPELSSLHDVEMVKEAAYHSSPPSSTPCYDYSQLSQAADHRPSEVAENFLSSTTENMTSVPGLVNYSSTEITPCNDKEEDVKKKELMFDQVTEYVHTPEKLLSNRKTISPASQEKLCQALNEIDLYDAIHAIQSSKTRKRLWYESLTGKEVPSVVHVSKDARSVVCSERMTKKTRSRNDSSTTVTKGILKSSDISCRSPCSCMKGSSTQKQTREAITFSQRQMHDIEVVATKLIKGLKSMKSIVEGALCQESCLPSTSKFTADEIRLSLDNASELEGYTTKWLSIMSRDCNRFCKIMRVGDKKNTSPVNRGGKERRRICFADEAGGMLCHVKVFE